MPDGNEDILLEVRELRKYFPVRKGILRLTAGYVRAVDGLSFAVRRGRTLGLVGESGCGKTTAGRTLLRLLKPTGGEILFDGIAVHALRGRRMRPLRRRMQMIFQDPYGSLNPRMTVESLVGEAFSVHRVSSGRRRRIMVGELLERVGLSPAHVNHYPHEFSGGQRQRIGIARALALNPDFIVCDEPVSALDVSIQAQIINLLADLQREKNISYLFISHDLGVVEHISHDVMVMYMGQAVECAPRDELYRSPAHPYTKLLLSAIPCPDPERRRRERHAVGAVTSPAAPQAACPFHPRCPLAEDRCRQRVPQMHEVSPGHLVRCFRA